MRKNRILKDIAKISVLVFAAFGGYLNFEPLVAGAATDDIIVTQHVTDELTISSPADVSMIGTIYGMTGGTGDGSATWTVTTNNITGFGMSIKTDSLNCMKNGGNYFNDYTTSSPYSYNWVAPAVSAFGFTVEPATAGDTVQAFRDNAGACNAAGGGNNPNTCWRGFNSTNDISIINRTTPTSISGEAEVVKFKAQLASGQFLPEGDYVATVTVTATMN